MKLSQSKEEILITLRREEALVLFEMLQRFTEDERRLLPLLHSSAEFAVLCRLNSHLEKALAEPFSERYEELLAKARKQIIGESGHYDGIEEK